MPIIDQIFHTFTQNGHLEYGERVNMLEHSLQTAYFAEQDGADVLLIASAVLHDYGHLIHGLDEDIAEHGIDGMHEEVGALHLAKYFVPAVTEPLRLHVAAKRYLCATDAQYFAELSPASILSLQVQGGPFNAEECREFETNPFYKEAIQLRRFDEMGKVPELDVPPLKHYRSHLERGLRE